MRVTSAMAVTVSLFNSLRSERRPETLMLTFVESPPVSIRPCDVRASVPSN